MTTQYYLRTHPAPNSRDVRIAGQIAQAHAAQAQSETRMRNISFAATAAAHTSAPPKSVNPTLGNHLDIKV